MRRTLPCLLAATGAIAGLHAAPPVYPEPREYRASGAMFVIDDSVSILLPSAPSNQDLLLARSLTAELSDRHGVAVRTRRVSAIPGEGRFIVMGSMRNPLVRSAAAGLQQTPQDLELAASNLGASRVTVLRRIVVPLILANLLAGALMAFAFAMLEVSDSLILAQTSRFYPITKAIWELSQRLGDGLYIASALGVWAMLLLTLTILSANSLLGRRMGAIFRV